MINIGIIGGGASGLLSAIIAARNGASVTVFEASDRFAHKLSITGNGKCNITNLNIMPVSSFYYADDYGFVEKVINKFSPTDAIKFFEGIGIPILEKRDGYLYPKNSSAQATANALISVCQGLKVKMKTNCKVTRVDIVEDRFILHIDDWKTKFDRIIIATGSNAGLTPKRFFSLYNLIKELGHGIKPIFPALTALELKEEFIRNIPKHRLEGQITLLVNEQNICSYDGEMQFNQKLISGVPVLQLSHRAVCAINEHKKVELLIDAFPEIKAFELKSLMLKEFDELNYLNIKQYLLFKLPEPYITLVLKDSKIDKQKLLTDIGDNEIENLINSLKSLKVQISGYNSVEGAQVMQGGVLLNEIDSENMESKMVNGLYFCGEIIDVDGLCGGYNLQWAWSSAYIAGMSASKEILN